MRLANEQSDKLVSSLNLSQSHSRQYYLKSAGFINCKFCYHKLLEY